MIHHRVHCDLANVAGLPMPDMQSRSFLLSGLPRTPQQKRGFVRQHSTKNWKHNLSNFSLQRKSRKEKTSHQKRGPAHGSYSFLNSLCTCSSEITWLSPLQSFYLFRAPPITCVSGERGVHFQPCLEACSTGLSSTQSGATAFLGSGHMHPTITSTTGWLIVDGHGLLIPKPCPEFALCCNWYPLLT